MSDNGNQQVIHEIQYSSQSKHTNELTNYQRYYKLSLITINLVFLIFSIILIALGSYALNSTANTLVGGTLPRGVIIIGITILFISLLGIIAAYRESRLLLAFYCAILILITLLLLGVAIAVYTQSKQTIALIGTAWIKQARPTSSSNSTLIFDNSAIIQTIQQTFRCCGLYDSTTQANPCIYTISCSNALQHSIQSTYYSAGACGIAFSILMVCCLAFIIILMNSIKNKQFMLQRRSIHSTYREHQQPGYCIELSRSGMNVINNNHQIINKPQRGNTMLYDQEDDNDQQFHSR